MNMEQVPDFIVENPDIGLYMPETVIAELKSELSKTVFSLVSQRIQGMDPDKKSVERVKQVAQQIGQKGLSSFDVEVLALALMFKMRGNTRLYSDDYGVRNLAHALDIDSSGVKTSGGKQLRKYYYICNACKTRFDHTIEECEVCGHTRFKRRF